MLTPTYEEEVNINPKELNLMEALKMIFKDDIIRELKEEAACLRENGDKQEIATYLGHLTILMYCLNEIQQSFLSDISGYKPKHFR